MKAIDTGSGVKVYDLNVGKTFPQWLSAKQRKSLQKDEGEFWWLGISVWPQLTLGRRIPSTDRVGTGFGLSECLPAS